MKKNIIDILFPAVSLDVVVAHAVVILNEPAIRALKTEKSVIVDTEKEVCYCRH